MSVEFLPYRRVKDQFRGMHALIYKSENHIRSKLQAFRSDHLNEQKSNWLHLFINIEKQFFDFKRINLLELLITYIIID